MKKFFTSACLLIAGYISSAQCSMGVAAISSGCPSTSYAYSTVQTFQPTCGGILRNVVAPNISAYSDDLRTSGYAVVARMRSASGSLLATSTTVTDQWYPGATATFDFTCANLTLAAGTTYQLEFFQTINPALPPPTPITYQLILFCRSATSIYAGGNYLEDGALPTFNPNSDLYGWTVNLVNGNIAAASSSATQTLTASSCNVFYNSSNEAIAKVQSGSTAMGSTMAKVFVQSSAPTYNTQPYVRRYYDITPATNASTATATTTLYFSQADFTDYNTNRGAYPSLPIDATDAANNKANLRITQQHGTSSTGAPGSFTGWNTANGPANKLITPTSVTWNSAVSRWEIAFPVTGFSGFFAHTGSSSPLPVKLVTFAAKANGQRNRLDWQTAVEDAGSTFTIERSSNGSDFSAIYTITGRGSNSNYTAYDDAPLTTSNYYRLKITDAGSTFTYSNIVSLRASAGDGEVLVAPVPAHDALSITIRNSALYGQVATISDLQGQSVLQFAITETNKVDITSLSPGIYCLHLPSGIVLKILKQ